MKRLIAMLLACAALVALTACGKDGKDNEETGTSTDVVNTQTPDTDTKDNGEKPDDSDVKSDASGEKGSDNTVADAADQEPSWQSDEYGMEFLGTDGWYNMTADELAEIVGDDETTVAAFANFDAKSDDISVIILQVMDLGTDTIGVDDILAPLAEEFKLGMGVEVSSKGEKATIADKEFTAIKGSITENGVTHSFASFLTVENQKVINIVCDCTDDDTMAKGLACFGAY